MKRSVPSGREVGFEDVATVTLDMDFHESSRLAEFAAALGCAVPSEDMEAPDKDLLDLLGSPNLRFNSSNGGDEHAGAHSCELGSRRKRTDFASTKILSLANVTL
ncbi:hypothetical protein BESB_053420 [Besnoitia besnoiti]|uniref:Uncharacterized protein n=1 Tax=Besnoitia besnoiti TaxID=94643 RepID=A0A2A9MHE6_BESBE|nr:hypothetical protein BESB_053420 [Besnoitia besnoiti]PFH35691.1 hypothetical protein BESB_053420 [Besnoitia besnoiti]